MFITTSSQFKRSKGFIKSKDECTNIFIANKIAEINKTLKRKQTFREWAVGNAERQEQIIKWNGPQS